MVRRKAKIPTPEWYGPQISQAIRAGCAVRGPQDEPQVEPHEPHERHELHDGDDAEPQEPLQGIQLGTIHQRARAAEFEEIVGDMVHYEGAAISEQFFETPTVGY